MRERTTGTAPRHAAGTRGSLRGSGAPPQRNRGAGAALVGGRPAAGPGFDFARVRVLEGGARGGAPVRLQRAPNEAAFPPQGKVETVRPGEHLLWNFGIGQTTLKPEHRAEIPKIVKEIKASLALDPTWEVDLEGQASSTGDLTRNEQLSAARVAAVRDALVAAGVDAARIRTTSVGSAKARPANENEETPEGMARSRGVRVILAPRMGAEALPATGPGTPLPGCQVQLVGDLQLEGGTVQRTPPPPMMAVEAGTGGAADVGMKLTASATFSPAGCASLVYVQNVRAFREIIYKDGSRNRFTSSAWLLDGTDPYPSQNFSPQPGSAVQVANDSPAQRVDPLSESVISTVEIRDEFRMFLVAQAPGGARQPLQVGLWTWIAQVRNDRPREFDNGSLVLDKGISRVIPKEGKGRPTSEAPATSPNVSSLRWVTDNGPVAPRPGAAKSFAETHARFLNRVPIGPRAGPV